MKWSTESEKWMEIGEAAFRMGGLSIEPFGGQQECDFAIPARPHSPAIFLQHSLSGDVMLTLGTTQAATGSAASISTKAKPTTLSRHFSMISLFLLGPPSNSVYNPSPRITRLTRYRLRTVIVSLP